MATLLKVELTMSPAEFRLPFRNFREAVFRGLRHECTVSIEAINAVTSVLYIRDLRAKFARSAVSRVRKIALTHTGPRL